jgi:hypothetical protein
LALIRCLSGFAVIRYSRIQGGAVWAGKRALLQAIPEIPEWVAGRRKRGFIFPFQRWLGNDWQEMINSVGAKTGVQCYSWYQRWTLFVLETWCAEMKVVQV